MGANPTVNEGVEMRLHKAILAAAVFGVATAAHAITAITETEIGVVAGANTTDTLGLFGPAGANLAGAAIRVHTQYIPSYFSAPTNCRNNSCTLARSQNANTPGAVLMSITIHGKQLTYHSTHFGQVLFGKQSSNLFAIYADTSDFGLGYTGVRVATSFSAPVTFGSELSPANPPQLGDDADSVEFFQPGQTLPGETLTFSVKSATE